MAAHVPLEAHEATLLGFTSEGWVYWGLTIFLLLLVFVFRFPKLIAKALDQRIADARRMLDEAKAVRAEAEALLVEAKTREHAAVEDAKAILAHAEVEARQLVAKAESDVADLIGRRERMAEDRISAAERQAIADMRAQAASLATAAAERLIRDGYDKKTDKALVDRTIAELGQR
jgi:F-type H+-transporting ATPase subunit b